MPVAAARHADILSSRITPGVLESSVLFFKKISRVIANRSIKGNAENFRVDGVPRRSQKVERFHILTIGDDPKLLDYTRSLLNELHAHQVRAEIDDSSGKIQRAEQMKIHTMFVIGKRDMDAEAVSVRVHGKGNLGAKPRAEAIAEILRSIKERRS